MNQCLLEYRPPTVWSVGALLREKRKMPKIQLYQGDLIWLVLTRLCKKELPLPSVSETAQKILNCGQARPVPTFEEIYDRTLKGLREVDG